MGQWDAAGLLGPALGPFDSHASWRRRDSDGAVLVMTEFSLRPRAPKPRFCRLFYKVKCREVNRRAGGGVHAPGGGGEYS